MGEAEDIQLLEAKLNELKVAYEKYFGGVERLEPARLRDEVQRMVRKTGTYHITNTGLKFKRDTIIAQFNTLVQHWNRILKQIEDGTYSRDLFRMKLKDKEKGNPSSNPHAPAGAHKDAPPPPATDTAAPGGRPAGPKASDNPTSPASSAKKPVSPPTGEYDYVYKSLVAAKQKLGEPTSNISYSALEWSLKKEAETIKKKFHATRVDFKIEIKDGKPVIKAVPIK